MEAFANYLWSPLFGIVVLTAVYAFGNMVTTWTKGLVSSMMVAAVIFIAGYVSGVLPAIIPTNTQLGAVLGGFGTLLMITHLGTIIKFKELLQEWKTVAVCLAGFIGILIVCGTAGIALFGYDHALTAVAPISGGIVAAQITADAATAAGKPELAAFAFLVMSFQGLIGMPIASFFLKKECDSRIAAGEHLVSTTADGDGEEESKKKLFKPMKPEYNTWVMMICKLAIVAWLGATFSWFLATFLNFTMFSAAVSVLFFGILFHELGFLDDDILTKAGVFNFLMLGLYTLGPSSYSALDFGQVVQLIAPLFGLLLMGATGIIALSLVAGKVLKVSTNLAISCGLAAMFGFPGTLILTTDAVNGTGLPEDQRKNLMDQILPKMIVAGFTTVTIASVIFAGILAPLIF
jgi:hypothetical protein